MKHTKFLSALLSACLFPAHAFAGNLHADRLVDNDLSANELTADEIIARAEKNGSGFNDMSQRLAMKNIEKTGEASASEMWVRVLADTGATKSLTVFTEPKREKGIALLSHSMSNGDSRQWLYLPSAKRVKKVAASNRESNFRGSEFTFEDLAGQDPAAYHFERAGEQACGNAQCYIVDRFPKTDDSAYRYTRLLIDKQQFLPRQAEFFDKKGLPLKTLNLENYQKYAQGFWKPDTLRMKNLQTGRVTELTSLSVEFNAGLKPAVFTETSLRSGI